jgi:hypothetical protein
MRILLDECLPRQLKRELRVHDVRTVPEVGWAAIKNGELLRLAAGQFGVFLTIDQRLERQERLSPGLSIVTLVARTNSIDSLRPLVPAILEALDSLTPGQRLRIGERGP